jgi:hypothetical protein
VTNPAFSESLVVKKTFGFELIKDLRHEVRVASAYEELAIERESGVLGAGKKRERFTADGDSRARHPELTNLPLSKRLTLMDRTLFPDS